MLTSKKFKGTFPRLTRPVNEKKFKGTYTRLKHPVNDKKIQRDFLGSQAVFSEAVSENYFLSHLNSTSSITIFPIFTAFEIATEHKFIPFSASFLVANSNRCTGLENYGAFLVSKFKLSIQTFDPAIQTFHPSIQMCNCSVQTFDPSIQTFNPSMQIWNGSIQTFDHPIQIWNCLFQTFDASIQTPFPSIQKCHSSS